MSNERLDAPSRIASAPHLSIQKVPCHADVSYRRKAIDARCLHNSLFRA